MSDAFREKNSGLYRQMVTFVEGFGVVRDSAWNIGSSTTTGSFLNTYQQIRPIGGISGYLSSGEMSSLFVAQSGDIISKYGGGIYSFRKTVATGVMSDFFKVSGQYKTHIFNLGINCSQSGFSVAKSYSLATQESGSPIINMLVNTGPYSNNDFTPYFNNHATSGLILSVGNSGNIEADITTTLFLFGSSQNLIIQQL